MKMPLRIEFASNCHSVSIMDKSAGFGVCPGANHTDCETFGRRGAAFEEALVWIYTGWVAYGSAHRAAYDSSIGDDGFLGCHWEALGSALLGLLNGELGNLDGGAVDRAIRLALGCAGFDANR